ncbi:nicotinate-nucleotide--dimethylbenzimidazole phosphoribosyltransferase [Vibrio tritonius]|uniref:nicotinate-nucleotide--dimethylbenzimidazole phosphoribosyltransferase n=1 Tax=Vibrio tritonius TaxID=1435069 RepID=UPI00315D5743
MDGNVTLAEWVAQIPQVNEASIELAQRHIDSLIKPIGSLGKLENIAAQLAAIYESKTWQCRRKKLFVLAADHGVFYENVAVTPREVTAIQAVNTVRGVNGVAALASAHNVAIEVIDAGIDSGVLPEITNFKVARGTDNMVQGPAMSRATAEQLILDIANYTEHNVTAEAWQVIGVGELGIANTTAAAAIVACMTGMPVGDVVGLGANLPSSQRPHKVKVVERALSVNQPNPDDGVDVMAKVGGFELAAMVGVMLGAAKARVPVILDGFLSYAAALVACNIAPQLHRYLIASHLSAEQGSSIALQALGLMPFIDLAMRLGEGSGAVLAMPFLDAARAFYFQMGKLADDGLTLPVPA